MMTIFTPERRRFRSRTAWATAVLALSMLGLLLTVVGGASAAPTAVGLGTADSFAVLAGAGITNTGPTTVNGDIGTFPTATITGSASITQTGTNHGGDAVTQGAKPDLVTAYNTAAGEGPTSPIGPGSPIVDLGGHILGPGVYNSGSTIGLTGVLTLDGGGNADAVFVFQAGSALTTASASSVSLINGAQACNVFWQITSDATLGTGSTFRGTLIALSSITVTTAVTVDGRVLARNGAVTLDTDTITRSACTTPTPAPPAPEETPPPATTTTPTPVNPAIAAAAAAEAAAATAALAATAAAKAADEANATAAKKAAALAVAASAKAQLAAQTAKKLAVRTKLAAVQAAAVKAAAAASKAKVLAAKATILAKVAAKRAAKSTHPTASVAHTIVGLTG